MTQMENDIRTAIQKLNPEVRILSREYLVEGTWIRRGIAFFGKPSETIEEVARCIVENSKGLICELMVQSYDSGDIITHSATYYTPEDMKARL